MSTSRGKKEHHILVCWSSSRGWKKIRSCAICIFMHKRSSSVNNLLLAVHGALGFTLECSNSTLSHSRWNANTLVLLWDKMQLALQDIQSNGNEKCLVPLIPPIMLDDDWARADLIMALSPVYPFSQTAQTMEVMTGWEELGDEARLPGITTTQHHTRRHSLASLNWTKHLKPVFIHL